MQNSSRNLFRAALLGSLSVSALIFGLQSAQAANATWLASPPTNDFNSGANWDTASVPGAGNTATFDFSDTTSIAVNQNTTVGEFHFTSGAGSYIFNVNSTAGADSILTLNTNGIVNDNIPDTIPIFFLTGGAHVAGLSFTTAGGAQNAVVFGSATNSSVSFSGTTHADNAFIDVAAVSFSGSSSASFAQIFAETSLSFTGTATAANSVIVSNGTGSFSGSATLDAGEIVNNGSLTFSGTATGGTGSIIEGSSATLDISGLTNGGLTVGSVSGGGQILLGANYLDTGSDDSSEEISATISGTGGALTKSGVGTLTLAGNNTYTGTTTINNGTLQIGNGGTSGTLGTAGVTGTGTLAFDRSDTVTVGNVIGGSLSLVQAGSGTVILTATNTYGGTTTIDSGATLQVGNGGAVGTLGAGNIDDEGHLVFNHSDIVTLDQTISGAGTFQHAGSGFITMTADNTYSGGTSVTGHGGLILGNGGATGSIVGDVALVSGTLDFFRSAALTFNGVISGPGNINQTGTGTITLTGANTFSGSTNIIVGTTLQAGAVNTFSPFSTLTDNGTLDLNSFNQTILQLTGGGLVTLGSATLTTGGIVAPFSGVISGSGGVTVTGVTALTLTGTNTYTGLTTISAGSTLQLGNGGATGSIASTAITDNGTLVVNRNNAVTLAADISGTGQLQQTGTGTTTVTGTDTYSGGTLISAGTLQIGNGGATGSIVGNVTNNAILAVNRSGSITLAGVISGTGSLQQNGTGTTVLTGANTYSGGTTISAGTLQIGSGGAAGAIAGNVTNNGSLAFDRSDIVTFAGVVSGTGSVQQIGTGTTILTATDTYSGGTTISAGTLQIGSGGAAGSITGNVTDNGTLAFDRSDSVTFAGLISGSGAVTQIGTGTTILTANETYTGGTTISAGTLQLGNGGATGMIGGNVTDNGTLTFDRSDNIVFAGVISGTGAVQQIGAGMTTLTATNTYSGTTTVTAGTLQLGNGGATGSVAGAIVDNAAVILNRSDNLTFANLVSGTGTFTKAGANAVIMTANNTYTGLTTIAGGSLQLGNGGASGLIAGNVLDNGTLIVDRSDTITLGGVISGTGGLSQIGSGNTILTATDTYSGGTTVSAGILTVNGSIANSIVTLAGGTLKGNGTVGGIVGGPGSNIAPGNSIGTLTVLGSVNFNGTTYQVEADSTGAADRINAGGQALLTGGTVAVTAAAGNYAGSTTYHIVSATGGVVGTFGSVSVNLTNLTPSLVYGATTVDLVLKLNTINFAPFTNSPNQVNTAAAVKAGGASSAVFAAILLAQPNTAFIPGALDDLSGEIHPTLRTAMLEDAGTVRQAIVDRLRNSSNGAGPAPGVGQTTLWARGFGGWGTADSDGNASNMGHNFTGIVAGIDTQLSNSFTLGVAGGYTHSHVGVNPRSSMASGDAGHVAGYAGWVDGRLALRLGGEYGWGDTNVQRVVQFPGFNNTLTDTQSDHTTQVFGEAGYAVGLGGLSGEPFAGIAWVDASTGAFAESGGAAALQGPERSSALTFSSLGFRLLGNPLGSGGIGIVPSASIAWQHAFGTIRPSQLMTFTATAQSFLISGVPLDRDAANFQAGLDFVLSPNAKFGVGYQGELSSNVQNHTVRADVSWTF